MLVFVGGCWGQVEERKGLVERKRAFGDISISFLDKNIVDISPDPTVRSKSSLLHSDSDGTPSFVVLLSPSELCIQQLSKCVANKTSRRKDIIISALGHSFSLSRIYFPTHIHRERKTNPKIVQASSKGLY